ncbi:MAG: SURF1 family protein [Alphaproteobacteria bacterium]
MSFRPRLWPTLFTIPALALLLALGTWQVQRLQWKTALIDKLQARSEMPAAPLPPRLDDPEAYEYRRVGVTGRFLHDRELHMVNRSLNGNPGLHILTPLERADGAGYVLINRGWVPFEREDPQKRPEGQVEGTVTVEGILRLAKGPGWMTPDNAPATNVWFYVEPAAMAKAAGVDSLPAFEIMSGDRSVPGGFPIGHQWRVNLRNDHLQYALTWYSLAAALLVIYVLSQRRREDGSE